MKKISNDELNAFMEFKGEGVNLPGMKFTKRRLAREIMNLRELLITVFDNCDCGESNEPCANCERIDNYLEKTK